MVPGVPPLPDHSLIPQAARIVERRQETDTVFSFSLELTDPVSVDHYRFTPGQFNMLGLPGVGEVPISIVSDPDHPWLLEHTVRAVGRVTRQLARLKVGDYLGIRGPFGRGWPLKQAHGKDVMIITGGLGCAPVVAVIRYVLRRWTSFGRLIIMQGVKHSDDFFWRDQYARWDEETDVEVLLASDVSTPDWPWYVGPVTALIDRASVNPDWTVAMLCGPEIMMRASADKLRARGLPEANIWLSMERNMQCAVGRCGHCQYGGRFICRDGPVFPYPEIKSLLGRPGF